MKRLTFFLLLTLGIGGLLPATAGAAERWKVLKAINWVENPTNHGRFGPKGELGPYQFRSSTWREYSAKPFSYAVHREHADNVAVQHYEWIKRGLTQAGIDPSPYNIALVWNSGLGAVKSGRVPSSTYRYAEQVSNLVEVLQRRAEPRAAPVAVVAEAAQPVAPAPALVINLETAPVQFVRAEPVSGPRFVVAVEAAPVEELPVVVTDKSVLAPAPTVAPATAEQTQFFVATALAAPRFRLID